MNEAERIVNTRNTQAFIDYEPLDIRLSRTITTRNTRGGVDRATPFVLEPQRVRFVDQRLRRNRSGFTSTTAGRMEVDFNRIIAPPDADIQTGDTFEHRGVWWKITKLLPKPFELIAEVDPLGDG